MGVSINMGFPGDSDSKESACNAGDLGSIPGPGRSPGGGHGHRFQYSCLENPHGQKRLVGYSPWGHKDSEVTERLHTAQHNACFCLYSSTDIEFPEDRDLCSVVECPK